ncbi:hypothetical protein SLE2022_279300 [Rubroshorea leprosula]
MVKHIELSYSGNEAFKVLAKNYLKLESHHLFSRISTLLQDARITPADVTEHLMPKIVRGDAEIYLESLSKGLALVKEERLKAIEEGKEKESSAKEEEIAEMEENSGRWGKAEESHGFYCIDSGLEI